ncbi:MAG: hypothetical protein DBX44_08730 [Oscillospiraceae bacterium]|nr:MAG: hypothetical protein DBX44_08730 [Oscillospiraceae bacterium]
MTEHKLEILLDVAETGNMSETGRKFYISPSSVSQIITGMEKQYGILLFDRSKQPLTLTPSGLRLCSYARQILSLYREMESSLGAGQGRSFRLGSSFSIASTFISPCILEFQKEAGSEIEIDLTINHHDKLQQQLLSYELDLAAMPLPANENPLLTSIPLFRDPVSLCCHVSHPFANRSCVQLSELVDQKITVPPRSSNIREAFEQVIRKNGVVLEQVFTSNGQAAIKDLVLRNQTISLLSLILTQENIRQGQLAMVKLEGFNYEREFGFLYRKDTNISPQLERFIRFCLEKRGQIVDLKYLL